MSVSVLTIISGSLIHVFLGSASTSIQAHKYTMATLEAQFQLERITGIGWTGISYLPATMPISGVVYLDVLYPVASVQRFEGFPVFDPDPSPGAPGFLYASWGDVFEMNGFGIIITSQHEAIGLLRAVVHIYSNIAEAVDARVLAIDDDDLEGYIVRLSSVLSADTRMLSDTLTVTGTSRFRTEPGKLTNVEAFTFYPPFRLRIAFQVEDTYTDEIFLAYGLMVPYALTSGYVTFNSGCRLQGHTLEFAGISPGSTSASTFRFVGQIEAEPED